MLYFTQMEPSQPCTHCLPAELLHVLPCSGYQVLSKAVSHEGNPQESWPPPQVTADRSGEASKLRAGARLPLTDPQ